MSNIANVRGCRINKSSSSHRYQARRNALGKLRKGRVSCQIPTRRAKHRVGQTYSR
jgi:hypothetical protein